MPRVDDEDVDRMIRNPSFYYTSSTIPPAFQFDRGVHYGPHNFSADSREPVGNGFEFPWKLPAGLSERSRSQVKAVKMVVLPGKPIVWWSSGGWVRWVFPRRTSIFECLFLVDPTTKQWHPFELRQRTRTNGDWDTAVFSPVAEPTDIAAAIGRKVSLLRRKSRIRSSHPDRTAFDVTATYWELPPLSRQETIRVLSRPFADVTGARVPLTSRQSFSIVPDGFMPHVGSDGDHCMDCHNDTMRSVDTFARTRDWYGLIRGDDGILSFHPFDGSSISSNGTRRPITINRTLLARGFVARYDRRVHLRADYHLSQ
jgi:hypothetical protein